jgi:ABC-2 type transport system ATP-binding protein
MPAVKTDNLTKVYSSPLGFQKVLALDRLTIQIEQGEVFGLLGPNGSGKTTTMKLLLGLLFPTAGSAEVLGRPAGDVAVKQRIGFLPEESYLYRFLTAEETLDFYGRLFEIPRHERRERTARLIKLVGLEEARKRPLKGYSKGMARRIGLAQALINDPELIFLDEPTSGLDPIGSREIKDLILDLKRQGKTVLLCSHLLADVQDVCDRIAILDRGQLKVVGPVNDLISVKDLTQITAGGLQPASIVAVKSAVTSAGGKVVSVAHPTTTLEELFLKVIGKQ